MQAFATGGGEFVELRFAIVLRNAPTCFEQALADESEEAGIERALLNKKGIARNLRDAQEDAVTVERAKRNGAENQQIKSAGEELGVFRYRSS